MTQLTTFFFITSVLCCALLSLFGKLAFQIKFRKENKASLELRTVALNPLYLWELIRS